MIEHDARSAECRVFTYKEGPLARFKGHDLALAVTRFTIAVGDDLGADGALVARCDAASLRVLGAVDGGRIEPSLSAGDRAQIEATLAGEILESARHPTIELRSQAIAVRGDAADVHATLTLRGRAREVAFNARRADGRWTAELLVHQPDFGITPYSVFGGVLRVRPDVRVRVSLPATP